MSLPPVSGLPYSKTTLDTLRRGLFLSTDNHALQIVNRPFVHIARSRENCSILPWRALWQQASLVPGQWHSKRPPVQSRRRCSTARDSVPSQRRTYDVFVEPERTSLMLGTDFLLTMHTSYAGFDHRSPHVTGKRFFVDSQHALTLYGLPGANSVMRSHDFEATQPSPCAGLSSQLASAVIHGSSWNHSRPVNQSARMAYKDLPHPSDMNDSTTVSVQEAAMKFLKCLAAVASLSLVVRTSLGLLMPQRGSHRANISMSRQTLALVAPRAGYQVANLSAEYQITPGGPSVVLDGTVQEARAQLLRLNPNWDSDFRRARELGSSALTKRNMWDGADVSCENRWGAVRPDAIKDGIKYLRGVEGKPSMGPGPGVCARVSCDVAAGIWWCNDASFSLEILTTAG